MLGREGNLISSKAAARGEIFNLMLPAPALGEGRIHDSAYHDLTAHPWAGLPVLVRLKATDGIGQTGYSSSKLTVLPAREFSHPVAAAIIEERRRLSRREGSRGGALRRHAAYNLGVLAKTPDEFGNDMVVFLGLQIARRRLLEDPAPSEFGEVQRLLWDIALRLDDDGLSLAERDFRAMIDMAREMLHTGSREGAREMLARFRETLENLQREGAPSSVFSKFMADVMPALNALMEEQQALLDESFSRARERSASRADGRSGGEEDGSAKALSRGEAQTDLRRQLDDFMNQLAGKLGEVPRELGQSSRSMGEASRALARDDLGEATDYQARALEGLRQGAKAAIETYLRQMEANRPAPEKAYIERLIPRY